MPDLFASTELTDEERSLQVASAKYRQLKQETAALRATLTQKYQQSYAASSGSGGASTAVCPPTPTTPIAGGSMPMPAAIARRTNVTQASNITEQVKQLVKSGQMTIVKPPTQAPRSTFKRAATLDKRLRLSIGGTGSQSTDSEQQQQQLLSPTDEHLASQSPPFVGKHKSPRFRGRTVQQSFNSRDTAMTDTSQLTIRGYDLVESTLRAAFEQFGDIHTLTIDERQKNAVLEYVNVDAARNAKRTMDGTMVSGITIKVYIQRVPVVQPEKHHRTQRNDWDNPDSAAPDY